MSKTIFSFFCLLLMISLIISVQYCLAESRFQMKLKKSTDTVNCRYLELKKDGAYCRTGGTLYVYGVDMLDSIIVFHREKKFDIRNVDKQKYAKMTDAVNRINNEKIEEERRKKAEEIRLARKKKEEEEQRAYEYAQELSERAMNQAPQMQGQPQGRPRFMECNDQYFSCVSFCEKMWLEDNDEYAKRRCEKECSMKHNGCR